MKSPSKELKDFETSFAHFRSTGMGETASREEFDLYCKTVEIFIGDLKNSKGQETEPVIRTLLKWTTAYPAYTYESWQQSWPWKKEEFRSRKKWAKQKG